MDLVRIWQCVYSLASCSALMLLPVTSHRRADHVFLFTYSQYKLFERVISFVLVEMIHDMVRFFFLLTLICAC